MQQVKEKCPFCKGFLTDVDGMLECQEGCGAHTKWWKDNSWIKGRRVLRNRIKMIFLKWWIYRRVMWDKDGYGSYRQ